MRTPQVFQWNYPLGEVENVFFPWHSCAVQYLGKQTSSAFFPQTVEGRFLSLTSKRALMIAEIILIKDTEPEG